jgi:DNA-binding CsgD family transcriptional regulator
VRLSRGFVVRLAAWNPLCSVLPAVVLGVTAQAELDGMPEPGVLRRLVCEGRCVVSVGRSVVYDFDVTDIGMRNLAIVALTDAGRSVTEVAAVFELTATYVSMLRGRARQHGSAGLVRRRGRPPKLNARQATQARRWADEGRSQTWIAQRFGVARSVVGRLLAETGPTAVQSELDTNTTEPVDEAPVDEAPVDEAPTPGGSEPDQPVPDETWTDLASATSRPVGWPFAPAPGHARIGTGSQSCRYAGAMLLHAYLHRVGAAGVLAALSGGPARRYDDLSVLTATTLAFALGAGTVEGTKHLRRAEAGAAVGLRSIPELRTLRERLGALADDCDPLAVQRAFATAMLSADPAGDPVYFVDDHFVPYSGAKPVAKGWNTKRRHAQPGRADTLVTDSRARAVCFASGEPSGLSATMPAVLAQLREVTGPDAPILLGFDRGGAYPMAFRACRDAGVHWLTYRRGKLAATTVTPRRSWTVREGRRVQLMLADETVQINGYGIARQLTLIEHGTPALQVLTSDSTATGAALLCWLRARWRIENAFKYASQHHGIDTLADYLMDLGPDQRMVTNPARTAARQQVTAAETALADAERALPQLLAGPATLKQKNNALPAAHRRIEHATAALEQAKAALRGVPAKVAATDLDPDAQRARPRIERRGLQMVLRLLAYNGEAWLAEHLNAYLADPDEHRAILRHLLHLGGHVDYQPAAIIVTLDRPDSPRVTRALQLLTDELNATPAHLPGDRRPLTYQLAQP